MVSGKEAGEIARQGKARAVREGGCRARRDQSLSLQQIEIRVERNASQRKDGSRANQRELPFEIGQAVADFFRQRLVGGRRAANRRRNQRVLEDQSVIGALRAWLISKPRAIELLVQKIPRAVSGEHSPRAVGPVRCWREANDD